MAFSGGTFTRQGAVHSGPTLWVDSANDGDATISASEHDTEMNDVAGALNALLLRDGSNAATANLDAGGFKIGSLAAGSATGNSGRWDEDVASIGLTGTVLDVTLNDGTALTQDLATVGSAGEVTLSGDQTITGKKTFTTATTPITDLRVLDTVYNKVNVLTAGGAVAVDTTAASNHYLGNDQAMTLTFTIPAASADTDLGVNFCTKGVILMRNETGHGAITLAVTADDTEEIGSRPTGATEMYSLVYQIWVMGAVRYAQFTWVSN